MIPLPARTCIPPDPRLACGIARNQRRYSSNLRSCWSPRARIGCLWY